MARKKTNILKSIAKNYKSKGTNIAKQGVYWTIWREEPPKKCKKINF